LVNTGLTSLYPPAELLRVG